MPTTHRQSHPRPGDAVGGRPTREITMRIILITVLMVAFYGGICAAIVLHGRCMIRKMRQGNK